MCLDRIDLVNGVIPQRELDSQVFIQMHEIGHILGVGSDLFQFYTNPTTGEPYGVRRGDFPCVEGYRECPRPLPHRGSHLVEHHKVHL